MAQSKVRATKKVRVSADDILGAKPKAQNSKFKKGAYKGKVDSVDEVTAGIETGNGKLDSKKFSKQSKWYVLSIQSGHEASVALAIKQRVDATGVQKLIGEVLIPTQKKIVVKGGKQIIKEEKILPGYVLVNMVLSEITWEIIRNTDGVTGFVRTDKYPRPLPDSQVKAIMKFMEIEQPEYQASFNIGDAVKVSEGAFADFIGSVQEIDESKGRAKVLLSFLGRETPVELDFSQISKL